MARGVPTTAFDHGNGSDYEIEVRITRPWVSVPVAILEDKKLSPSARIFLICLLGLAGRPGWTIRISNVLERLGLSRARWANACRQLKARGYYASFRVQERDTGKIRWKHIVTDEPSSLPGGWGEDSVRKKTIAKFSSYGESSVGSSGVVKASHIHMKTSGNKNLKAAAAPKSEASAPSSKKYGSQRCVAGVTVWTESDLAVTDTLVADYGESEVVAAAKAISALGDKPYPSKVREHLASKRRDALAEARKSKEADRLKRFDEESRKRGAREMEELLSESRVSVGESPPLRSQDGSLAWSK